MSEFKLPPISPLLGSNWSTFFGVLKGNRVHPKRYIKVAITFLLLIVSSAFQWIDRLYFRRKVKKFVFKESPLFIIGHWRSGTTFLHNMLTKDSAAGYTRTYQSVFPNNLKSKWLFKTFMRIFMPDERPGDGMKISADLPQEDEYAMSNITHRSFYHYFYFPSSYRSLYKKYIRFESLSEKEIEDWKRNYKQMVIKALINTNGSRAVLKNPVNTGRMLTLSDIFPESSFIFIVRNPVIVYLSTKKFYGQLFPTLNLEVFTLEDITSLILETYEKLLKDYLSDKKQMNSDRLIEMRYDTLVENPIKEIERVYSKFSLGNFKEVKQAFQEYLTTLSDHREDSYSIDQQELDRVLEHVGFAMKHWNYDMPENLTIIDN
jgi:hypothetical protein